MQQDNNNILKIVKISIYKILPHLPFPKGGEIFPPFALRVRDRSGSETKGG